MRFSYSLKWTPNHVEIFIKNSQLLEAALSFVLRKKPLLKIFNFSWTGIRSPVFSLTVRNFCYYTYSLSVLFTYTNVSNMFWMLVDQGLLLFNTITTVWPPLYFVSNKIIIVHVYKIPLEDFIKIYPEYLKTNKVE